jgi:predicted neuraminidase
MISDREGTMVRNKPIVLSSGEWMLPVYQESGNDTESVGADSTSRFLVAQPGSTVWKERGFIRSKKGNLQPGVVEIAKDHLIAYCRRGGGYGKVSDGWTVRAESRDGGRTWTEGTDSKFPNPNSALELLKLRSGKLLMIYNDSMYRRTPLKAAVSLDGDRTWQHKPIGEDPKQSYAYPSAVESPDGRIHVVWTGDNRTAIYYTSFKESWLTQAQ